MWPAVKDEETTRFGSKLEVPMRLSNVSLG